MEKGVIGLMSSKKNIKREPLAPRHVQEPFFSEKAVDYQEQINKLQLKVYVLKETINILKKDLGVDMVTLNNREKTVVVSALKEKYTLSLLLYELDLPRSSYFYRISVMKQPDKYAMHRSLIKIHFMKTGTAMGIEGYGSICKIKGLFYLKN